MKLRSVATLVGRAASRDPVTRRAGRHQLVEALARRSGFQVYKSNVTWPDDPDFHAAWRRFPEWTPNVRDRKFVLWSIGRSLADVDGDTAECGSYNGATSHLICSAVGARHHVFDSFEGLSAPAPGDQPVVDDEPGWAGGEFAADEARVRRNLAGFDVVTYKGWIPDRFAEVAGRHFRLVHLDVNLYEPTRDGIEFFYPRLNPGGILVCDDYGFATCPGATRAMDEYGERIGQPVLHLSSGQGLLFRR